MEPEVKTNNVVRPGDKIKCTWGKLGIIDVTVRRVSSHGTIYAVRYFKKTRSYSLPRRIFVNPDGTYRADVKVSGSAEEAA